MTMSSSAIFDRAALRRNRDRAAKGDAAGVFLQDWCLKALAERLDVIKRRFGCVLLLGGLGTAAARHAFLQTVGPDTHIVCDPALTPIGDAGVQADFDFLPFRDHSFDLVASPFALHSVDDLPGALLQIRRVLRPDGLFLGAMAGGETLYQLRQCLLEAEAALRGGASPRVFPFADKPQAGALMQRAGFALPVIESELVTVTYATAFDLYRDLRGMGEGNAILARQRVNPGRALFIEAARLYAERFAGADGRIEATFEIIFLLGWSPHASQQQPLRPGQAKHRLADALASTEMKL